MEKRRLIVWKNILSTQPIYRKYFQVAGLSIEVRSDIPFKSDTFASKFDHFEINKSYEDNVVKIMIDV